MPVSQIVGGQLPFTITVSLTDGTATVATTNVSGSDAGILYCFGQMQWLTVEAALASGNDPLQDFLIQVLPHVDASWHDNQDTAGDAIETTANNTANALTINLGNPWAIRFKAQKNHTSGTQLLTIRGVLSAKGLVD